MVVKGKPVGDGAGHHLTDCILRRRHTPEVENPGKDKSAFGNRLVVVKSVHLNRHKQGIDRSGYAVRVAKWVAVLG